MHTMIRRSLATLSVIGVFAVAGHEAAANVSATTGFMFKPYAMPTTTSSTGAASGPTLWNQESVTCWGINPTTAATGKNTCATGLYVQGQVAYPSSRPLSLSGFLSRNDSCYVLETNTAGAVVFQQQTSFNAPAGSIVNALNQQTQILGTPPALSGDTITIACYVEPGGTIQQVWE